MLGKVLLITGGKVNMDFAEEYTASKEYDTVVCADSGLNTAYRLGMPVHYFMGDFDSVSPEILEAYREGKVEGSEHCEWVRYPKEKDYVDTQLVLEWILEKGADEITFLGATGGRLDHFLANVNILMLALKQKVPAYIVDSRNRIRLTDSTLSIERQDMYGKYLSLLPLTSTVTGVTLRGLKYLIEDYTLEVGIARAISNEMDETSDKAEILLRTGVLIVVESKD
ncbi:MAG: thiamine diphosphokinase [Roseburia sp.]|nr:thiamine diphosphokinase [Roseburia sp.]